ncbi:MAG: enoyl-CoA hydratase/isomerase family protein [Chitinophagales bacterium]
MKLENLKTLACEIENNTLIIQLNRGKANPMNMRMVSELREAIAFAAENKAIHGVILTGKQHFFSAGVDIIAAYQLDKEGIKAFWRNFSDMVFELSNFPKPMISAITGYAPAGGCVLAICCDYRVMAEGKYSIGLNEIPVGIIVPETIFHLYSFWLGNRLAYQYLLEGKLLKSEEALAVGLVDKTVDASEVLATAKKQMAKYYQFEANTWQTSKMNMRKELLAKLDVDFEALFAPLLEQWWQPTTRKRMATIIASLKKS